MPPSHRVISTMTAAPAAAPRRGLFISPLTSPQSRIQSRIRLRGPFTEDDLEIFRSISDHSNDNHPNDNHSTLSRTMPSPLAPWPYGVRTSLEVGSALENSSGSPKFRYDALGINQYYLDTVGERGILDRAALFPPRESAGLENHFEAIRKWNRAFQNEMIRWIARFRAGDASTAIVFWLCSPVTGDHFAGLGTLPCHYSLGCESVYARYKQLSRSTRQSVKRSADALQTVPFPIDVGGVAVHPTVVFQVAVTPARLRTLLRSPKGEAHDPNSPQQGWAMRLRQEGIQLTQVETTCLLSE